MRERLCLLRAIGNGVAPRGAMPPARLLIRLLPAILLLILSGYAEARVTLSADVVQASFLESRGVQVSLSGLPTPVLKIRLDEIAIEGRRWRNLQFSCPVFHISGGMVRCDDGVLRIAKSEPLPVAFRFSASDNTLQAAIRDMPADAEGEGWKLFIHGGVAGWEGTVTVENGKAAQVAAFLPVWESQIDPSSVKGKINGMVQLSGQSDGLARADVKLALNEVTFSDATGLHAGENISIDLNAEVMRGEQRERDVWQWNVDASWPKGEVFWQPLYFAGRGHRFHAGGDLDEDAVRLRKGRLALADIGEVDFSGTLDSGTKALREFSLAADNLQLAGMFEQVLQPFLVNTSFAGLKAIGQAGIRWRYRDRAHQLLDVYLQDVSVQDGQERFALEGMNARIPWQAGDGAAAKDGEIMIAGGRIGRIPIGPVHFPLEVTGLDEPGVRIAQMTVPILDGQLMLEQFSAQRQARRQEETTQAAVQAGFPGWEWEFSGRLMPISMQKLTEALETQTMQGTLSGEIPKVSYKGSTMNVEGALVLRVFDGSVVVWNLKALDPFGHASSLMADVDMRNLDLNLLTGTFSFGKILGRIDVAVHNLELFGWKPVKFDASLKSSPGEYPRRISQDAVQNISSLGGSGAVAAVQRSVLRFFDEFGYSQIGWSCVLRNGICRMGGIASEPLPHGYLIVRGGGIPAISVIGYNRDVDWPELVSRLQRITGDHTQPVIQ